MEEMKKEPAANSEYVLEVKNLVKWFPIKSGIIKKTIGNVKAVDGVSFKIRRGETMGLVGESGCGKSTCGRTILRLLEKTSGEVLLEGVDVFSLSKEELRKMRPRMQIVFQDPYSSLSPRLPIGEIIGEAVREHHIVPPEEFDDYITRVMEVCQYAAPEWLEVEEGHFCACHLYDDAEAKARAEQVMAEAKAKEKKAAETAKKEAG